LPRLQPGSTLSACNQVKQAKREWWPSPHSNLAGQAIGLANTAEVLDLEDATCDATCDATWNQLVLARTGTGWIVERRDLIRSGSR
jgi:hypothetical protein